MRMYYNQDIYIISYVKQTTSQKRLHNTGSPSWCAVMTWRAGISAGERSSREREYIFSCE